MIILVKKSKYGNFKGFFKGLFVVGIGYFY